MRDFFYNRTHDIGSSDWIKTLNEAELSEWNWINSNMELVEKYVSEFELKEAKARAHILQGLKVAQENIDEVVSLVEQKSKELKTN